MAVKDKSEKGGDQKRATVDSTASDDLARAIAMMRLRRPIKDAVRTSGRRARARISAMSPPPSLSQ